MKSLFLAYCEVVNIEIAFFKMEIYAKLVMIF